MLDPKAVFMGASKVDWPKNPNQILTHGESQFETQTQSIGQ